MLRALITLSVAVGLKSRTFPSRCPLVIEFCVYANEGFAASQVGVTTAVERAIISQSEGRALCTRGWGLKTLSHRWTRHSRKYRQKLVGAQLLRYERMGSPKLSEPLRFMRRPAIYSRTNPESRGIQRKQRRGPLQNTSHASLYFATRKALKHQAQPSGCPFPFVFQKCRRRA